LGWWVWADSGLLLLSPLAVVTLALLFFMPVGRTRRLRVGEISERVDERDIMFAREEYLPGTEHYGQYYAMRPENKTVDDRLRELPELLEPGGRFYDPVRSMAVADVFRVIEGMLSDVDGDVSRERVETDPDATSREIKNMTLGLGANEVGIARLDPMFVYSHVGRGPEPWGQPINNNHRFVIAFSLEMDYWKVEEAPDIGITEETAGQYLNGALISIALARHIRGLGYPARAHIAGSNYQIMLPPVAHAAGLGELGRIGYLMSPRYGARIRLGAVTTDIPLISDHPRGFGVQDFCAKCCKCAVNCPSGAIPLGDPVEVRGVWKWPLNMEKCLRYWRLIGTDCGLCMKVCPYSHPPTFLHNLVRAGIRRSAVARTLSVWGDDLLYGPEVRTARDFRSEQD
jgi:ferredoxin